jgi:phospholipase A2
MSLPDLPKLPSMPTMEMPDFGGTLKSWRESLGTVGTALEDIQSELSGTEGSVYNRVISERDDARVNPEIQWDASVRLGNDLGTAERAFVRARKEAMLKPFCELLGLKEEEVELEDIPVVAFAASGGGYRAMVSTLGSLSAAQSSGIWDLTSYTSAISGSCWAINTLYAIGGGDIQKTLRHVKSRITTPFLDPESMQILTNKPTNKVSPRSGCDSSSGRWADDRVASTVHLERCH